ncbi:MAG: zinc transporter ZupT [Deltaproteobacteria bacterium]|nr:zinc transporter ZupT [Deltaproteobacteria bacterium]
MTGITNHTIWIALGLTALAGLSTTIGSLIAVFYRTPGPKFMAFTMGFSAGVMILVSFVELLGSSITSIGFGQAHLAFFTGFIVMLTIDYFTPHTYIMESNITGGDGKLKKAAIFVALGIAIHNFPEGMVTFAGTLQNIDIGISLAVAIAIHNIPEGIAVAVPVYAVTRSAGKAFKWSFLSGVSEPVGAVLALLVLMPILTEFVLGWMLALVAGFMVFISLDELLPVATSYGEEHLPILGVITGMGIMALSLYLII